MAIAFVAPGGTDNQSASNTLVVPNTTPSGAIIIAEFAQDDAVVAVPSGYTIIGSVYNQTSWSDVICYKIATSGDAGTNVVVPTASGTIKWANAASVYSGVDTASPVLNSSFQPETVSGTTHAVPAITVGQANCWVVRGMIERGTGPSGNMTLPGYTNRHQPTLGGGGTGGGALGIGIFDSNGVVATGTVTAGTVTCTMTTGNARGWSVLLKPAAGATVTATGKVPNQLPKWLYDNAAAGLASAATPALKLYYFGSTGPGLYDPDTTYLLSHVISAEMPTANGYTVGGLTLGAPITDTYDATNDRAVLTTAPYLLDPGAGHTFTPYAAAIVLWRGSNATSPIILWIDFGGALAASTPLQLTPDPSLGWAVLRPNTLP